MKKLWIKTKLLVSWLCLRVVCNWCPQELKRVVDEEANARASVISREIVMKYLEKNGLLHCYVCPSRFGLIKKELMQDDGHSMEVFLCPTHHAVVSTKGAASAVQRR